MRASWQHRNALRWPILQLPVLQSRMFLSLETGYSTSAHQCALGTHYWSSESPICLAVYEAWYYTH